MAQVNASIKKINKNKKTAAWKQFSFNDYIVAAFLAVAVAIVPTIVRLREISFNADEQLVRNAGSVYDAFTYYKSSVLLVAGVCICLFYLACVCIGDMKPKIGDIKEPVFIASVVYVLSVVISTVFSQYKILALNGFSDRHESVFILAVYTWNARAVSFNDI